MLHGEAVVMRLLRQNATLRGMEELGMAARELELLPARAPTAARHHPGHRPDRQRQDLDALHGPERNQRCRPQDHHHRRPGGIPAQGRQPNPGLRKGRADLCPRAALHFAPRPGRGSDRRNPRPGDGADRGAGLADRPPGLLDPPHQRRPRRPDPPGGYGRRALPGGLLARGGAGPAPGARPVPALQTGGPFPAAQAFKEQVGIAANTTIYRSVGCEECRQTGFYGRHAIFEWMDSTTKSAN